MSLLVMAYKITTIPFFPVNNKVSNPRTSNQEPALLLHQPMTAAIKLWTTIIKPSYLLETQWTMEVTTLFMQAHKNSGETTTTSLIEQLSHLSLLNMELGESWTKSILRTFLSEMVKMEEIIHFTQSLSTNITATQMNG